MAYGSARDIATITGLVSWSCLRHRSIRGDYALVVIVLASSILYLVFTVNGVKGPLCLTLQSIFSYLSIVIITSIGYHLSPGHPLAKFPGPLLWRVSGVPLAIASFRGYRHLVLDRFHKKYGRIVRIGPHALSINSCDAFNTIYGSENHMKKSDCYKFPGHVKGITLFFQQNKVDHAVRKQIWSQAFTPTALENFFPLLDRRTWQLVDCIENRADDRKSVDLTQCLCHWAYDFMGEMVFGGCNALELMRNGDPRELIMGGKKATIALDSFGQVPWILDILWHIPASQSMHRLRHIAASMMRVRVQAGLVKIRDLTSYLLDGHPRTGQHIPLAELEMDAIVAIQGGSDNTATMMALAIYFVLSSPRTYKSLRTALDQTFSDPLAPLDNKLLASIPILNAVLTEALRLGSPFFLPRSVPAGGAIIGGAMIPGGTTVALAAYSQQISEENFSPDPLKFLPERWLPGGLGPGSITNKMALFTFSTGPDMCIAKTFAMQEMRLCLSRLVLIFDMELPEGFDVEGFYKGLRNMRTTVFDMPLMVKMNRREGRSTPPCAY